MANSSLGGNAYRYSDWVPLASKSIGNRCGVAVLGLELCPKGSKALFATTKGVFVTLVSTP
jgi:hypothetical protein